MKIFGFNFTKLSIEKFPSKIENIKINTNLDVSEIKQVENSIINSDEKFFSIEFSYKVSYNSDIAELNLAGNILLSLENKKAAELVKQWKDKKMPEDFRFEVFNLIIKKSILKALQLEEDIGLPPHVPLPSLKKSEEAEKKK
jgi:hypothetical protein